MTRPVVFTFHPDDCSLDYQGDPTIAEAMAAGMRIITDALISTAIQCGPDRAEQVASDTATQLQLSLAIAKKAAP